MSSNGDINLTPEQRSERHKFFHGKVNLLRIDDEHTTFRVVDGGAIVQISNATHTRLIESKRYPMAFEVLAPYTPETGFVTEVIKGEIPDHYIKEYPLAYYEDLNSKYVAMQMKNGMRKLDANGKLVQSKGCLFTGLPLIFLLFALILVFWVL